MRFQHLMVASSLVLTPILLGGCSRDDVRCGGDDCDNSLGEVTQAAFLVGSFVPWPLNNGILNLCFSNPTAPPTALSASEFSDLSNHMLFVLNNTWGNVPNLHFQPGCTAPALSIALANGGGQIDGGSSSFGNGAKIEMATDPNNLADNDATIVHEVGHALGLLHENQRPDAEPLCEAEQNILNGCTKCATGTGTCTAAEATECWFWAPEDSTIVVTASDKTTAANLFAGGKTACQSCAQGTCVVGSCSAGPCAPSDSYLGCFGTNPSFGTLQLTTHDIGSAQGRVADRTAINDGRVLTTFDPLSIVNYCASANGRVDGVPTPRDMLGMEMMYSTARVYGLGCGSACFTTASGPLTLDGGSVVSEWIARGSLNVPFRVSGTSTDVYSYSVSGLAAGSSTISYSFSDPLGNSRSGSGTVKKSNASYSAIAGTILASID